MVKWYLSGWQYLVLIVWFDYAQFFSLSVTTTITIGIRMCKNRTVISTKEGQMHSQTETKSEMFQKIKLKRLGQCRGLQQCGNWCLKRYIQFCEQHIAKMQHDHFQIMGKHWCSDQWHSQLTDDAQASKFLHLRGSNSDCSWHYFWNAVGLESVVVLIHDFGIHARSTQNASNFDYGIL